MKTKWVFQVFRKTILNVKQFIIRHFYRILQPYEDKQLFFKYIKKEAKALKNS